MTTRPEVSFVITGLDAVSTVREAICSALEQTVENLEVIYVDDGSTDGSAEAVADLEDTRLSIIRLMHVGRSAALNHGVYAAESELVAILDADDVALPTRVHLQTQFLNAHPYVQVVGGQLEPFDASGRVDTSGRWRFPTRPNEIDAWLKRGRMPLAHNATTFRRSWFAMSGGYDSSVIRAEDFDLFLRNWIPGTYAAVPQIVTRYRTSLFPSWKYWHQNEDFRRAVYRRWRHHSQAPLDPFNLEVRKRDRLEDVLKWTAQSVFYHHAIPRIRRRLA